MTSPSSRRFSDALAQIEQRLARIEASLRTPQLGNSSLQDETLHVFDALGQVRQRIGKQSDGTFAVSYTNGVKPPAPSTPTVQPRQLSLSVSWDGGFGADTRPGDFARVDVHASTTSGFVPDGSTLVGSLNGAGAVTFTADNETYYVKAVAVSNARVASDSTAEVSAVPLPASVIAAGSIGAQQLAAQIVLGSKIIAGDPAAQRLELGSDGIRQFATDGTQTVYLGSDPGEGNYFSVANPGDGSKTLATLSDDGALAVQELSVAGDATVGGRSLSDLIAAEAGGIVARAKFGSDGSLSPSTTSETAWFEVAFQAVQGRLYRIQSGPFIAHGGGTDIRLRYTTDGSSPSTTSARLTRCGANDGETVPPMSYVGTFQGSYVRVLLSVASWSGVSVQVGVVDDQAAQFWVEDIGLDPGNTGSLINSGNGGGGGAQAAPKTAYTTRWNAAWMQCFNSHGVRTDGQAVQGFYDDGYNGDNTIMIGFDDANIRAQLAGSTINWINVFLYSWHWYYNSGGFAAVGTHNVAGGPPAGYSTNHWGVVEAHMPKPGGAWIGLPQWVGNELRDNASKGIVLDAIYRGHDLNYYGKFDWPTDAWSPAIEINYTK